MSNNKNFFSGTRLFSYSVVHILLYFSPHFIQYVQCSLITKPQNVAAMSGDFISLSCASNSEDSVAWVAYSPGSSEREYIFSWGDLSQKARQYISISQEGKGHCSLHINATKKAAGRYICVEPVSTLEASAEVIIFETTPECLTKLTDDFVNMTCSAKFAGNWAPTMEWKTQKNTAIGVELFSSHDFVTTYSFLPLNITINSTAYKINVVTKFNESGRPKKTSATNVPEFNHTISPYSSGIEYIAVTLTVERHVPSGPGVVIALSCIIAILCIGYIVLGLILRRHYRYMKVISVITRRDQNLQMEPKF